MALPYLTDCSREEVFCAATIESHGSCSVTEHAEVTQGTMGAETRSIHKKLEVNSGVFHQGPVLSRT